MKRMKLVYLLLALILFIPFMVNADSCDSSSIKIESIRSGNTSGNAEEINEATLTNGKKVNLDLKLYDPGDSIEYSLVIKNTSGEDFYFDEESLKVHTDYVEYEFSYDDNSNLIKAGETKTIKLKVIYKNKVPADQLDNDIFNNINEMTLRLSNKDIISDLINPETGNMIKLFIIILLLSGVICLLVLKTKKPVKYMIFIMGIMMVIPMSVYALCKNVIDLEVKIQIDGKEAYFLTGSEVNITMKELAGDNTSSVTNGYTFQDQNITSIEYSSEEPIDTNKEEKNIVSIVDSPYPIYMWFDNGTIYWWSEDKTPSLNPDSSQMFRNLNNLENISGLSSYDASRTTTLQTCFAYTKLNNISALSSWDTSNVESMSNTFAAMPNLTNLNGIDNWNLSKVLTIQGMFMNDYLLEDISSLKKWDVSRVENMRALFQNNNSLSNITPLQSWNVSNVKTMNRMFFGNQTYHNKIESLLPLKDWNTSSLEDMELMFQASEKITNINGLENWNVSSVKTMNGLFNNCYMLESVDLSNWDMSSVTNTTFMLSGTGLKKLKTPKVYPNDSSVSIELPLILYDENGNQYNSLNKESPTEILLIFSAP